MKIKPQQIERFLRTPDSKILVFLFYGPNHGLMVERANQLAEIFCADLGDPFLSSELTNAAIKGDAALLASEISSQSLLGGERLVRVRDATDAISNALESTLEIINGGKLILYAGDLSPRSTLRKLCENDPHAAAIACYAEEGAALNQLIGSFLQQQHITIDQDALQYLQDQMGQDRAEIRMNLQKLMLYLNAETHITLAIAAKVISQSAQGRIDDLLHQAFGGKITQLDRNMQQFFLEGGSSIALLRASCNHIIRLQACVQNIQKGMAIKDALNQLRPRVFFKQEQNFIQQLRLWQPATLKRFLRLIIDCEKQGKWQQAPQDLLSMRIFHQICATAKRQSQR